MEDFSEQQIKTLKTVVTQIVKDESRETRDFVRQEIQAAEKRIIKNISEQVGQIIDGSIVPQLEDQEQRLTELETKPAWVAGFWFYL